MDLVDVESRYGAALNDFFNHYEEKALYEVSLLGKELVVSQMGPDILLEVHSRALRRYVEKMDPVAISRVVVTANEVLLSGIMAYAMNYYSYMEVLAHEKVKLEKVQAELREKAYILEEANVRLREIDELKSLFIASMSHELRTPLNSIIGFSTILIEEWVGPLNSEQKENLAIIARAGQHLLDLINDIIDISKIEAGKVEPEVEPFPLRQALVDAVDALRPEAVKKGLELAVDAPDLHINSDRRRLMQCILNLVSNAVKFTEKGRIVVKAGNQSESTVRISVSDTGIGIPPNEAGKIFMPFLRLEAAQKARIPGTGLGLYLTHKLVSEILHGTISFSSNHGSGTTFTIEMPTDLADASPAPAGAP